jgi:hypothetical protein
MQKSFKIFIEFFKALKNKEKFCERFKYIQKQDILIKISI